MSYTLFPPAWSLNYSTMKNTVASQGVVGDLCSLLEVHPSASCSYVVPHDLVLIISQPVIISQNHSAGEIIRTWGWQRPTPESSRRDLCNQETSRCYQIASRARASGRSAQERKSDTNAAC